MFVYYIVLANSGESHRAVTRNTTLFSLHGLGSQLQNHCSGIYSSYPRTWEIKAVGYEVQNKPPLYCKFKASLGYMRQLQENHCPSRIIWKNFPTVLTILISICLVLWRFSLSVASEKALEALCIFLRVLSLFLGESTFTAVSGQIHLVIIIIRLFSQHP